MGWLGRVVICPDRSVGRAQGSPWWGFPGGTVLVSRRKDYECPPSLEMEMGA